MLTGQRDKVYLDRYSLKNDQGAPTETIEQTWDRVAGAIGDTSSEVKDFRELLADFKFVPGGRILAGAGTNTEVTFFNCYVIPVRNESVVENGNDSREAIFDTISRMVNIMSRGGGVGINWSTLRPRGAYLKRINGTTTGPLEWMDVASSAVGAVMQGGSRRGAAMFMLNDWHPDVIEFVGAKRDLKKITNANISVAVSDAFMTAVKTDGDWDLVFPDTSHPEYNAKWDGILSDWVEAGYPVKTYLTVKARDIWQKLAEGAWDNGEPGIIFLDRYNNLSTAASIEKIISVNPCGEQGLGAYSVCNLGAMNVAAYASDDQVVTANFDMAAFRLDVGTAIHFLDNVIDQNPYGDFTETYAQQVKLRRVGLSVMGLADALIRMKLRYGSPLAVAFTENLFKNMKEAAIDASIALAHAKGPAEGWEPSMADRPYLVDVSPVTREKLKQIGLRNLFLLTQAPTGTTSIVAGVNSGIEPYFAFEYQRNDRTGSHIVRAPVAEDYKRDFPNSPLPDYFVTANDLSVEDHVYMQAAAQKYIDSSVSKTLNAPNSHKVEDVVQAYSLAYDAGLKSIAYFRDGCGRDQVLNNVEKNGKDPHVAAGQPETNGNTPLYRRGTRLTGHTSRIVTSAGTTFVTVNLDEDKRPREVFVNIGKAGTDLSVLSEAIGRLISISLQRDIPVSEIRDQLFGVGGYSKLVKSLPSAIASAIGDIQESVAIAAEPVLAGRTGTLCPECKTASVSHAEGCETCANCGWSKC